MGEPFEPEPGAHVEPSGPNAPGGPGAIDGGGSMVAYRPSGQSDPGKGRSAAVQPASSRGGGVVLAGGPPSAPRTVGDRIRANAHRLGVNLDHLDDHEIGVRLAAMPVALADDPHAVAVWMLYGLEEAPPVYGRGVLDPLPA